MAPPRLPVSVFQPKPHQPKNKARSDLELKRDLAKFAADEESETLKRNEWDIESGGTADNLRARPLRTKPRAANLVCTVTVQHIDRCPTVKSITQAPHPARHSASNGNGQTRSQTGYLHLSSNDPYLHLAQAQPSSENCKVPALTPQATDQARNTSRISRPKQEQAQSRNSFRRGRNDHERRTEPPVRITKVQHERNKKTSDNTAPTAALQHLAIKGKMDPPRWNPWGQHRGTPARIWLPEPWLVGDTRNPDHTNTEPENHTIATTMAYQTDPWSYRVNVPPQMSRGPMGERMFNVDQPNAPLPLCGGPIGKPVFRVDQLNIPPPERVGYVKEPDLNVLYPGQELGVLNNLQLPEGTAAWLTTVAISHQDEFEGATPSEVKGTMDILRLWSKGEEIPPGVLKRNSKAKDWINQMERADRQRKRTEKWMDDQKLLVEDIEGWLYEAKCMRDIEVWGIFKSKKIEAREWK